METLRLSATDVDKFRAFRADEGADLAAFLDEMRRKSEPSPAMMAGVAFHSALEKIGDGDHATLTARGYTFQIDCDDALDLPPARELKTTAEYIVAGCRVTMVAKVDAVHGRRIDDHKLTGWYDPERFLSSYQWRLYLDAFGADEFRWNVFEGAETRPHSRHYAIKALHVLSAFRYPAMRADVENEIGLFVEFARQWLPERIMREAA